MFRIVLSGLALVLFASPVVAHPKVLTSVPAAGTSVAAPAQIKLEFSEKLFDKLSGAKLIRADGQPVAKAAVSLANDGKSMQIVPAAPLTAGGYTVEWYGVGGDTHRVTGSMQFTVR